MVLCTTRQYQQAPKRGRLREIHCTLACDWATGNTRSWPKKATTTGIQSGPRPSLGKNLDGARRLSRLATISKIYAQATAPWGLSTAPCDYQSDAFRSSTTTAGFGNSRPPCGDGMRGCEFTKKGMAMCSERAPSASAITLGAQARPQRDSRREQLLACPNETAPQVVSFLLCVKAWSPVPPFLLLAKCVHAIDSHLTTPCKVLTYCVLPLLSSF